ncbi:hypothetical protein Tco_1474264, partial [Tanacetum coccineum]
MHNNIMAAGLRDRPPILTTGRYAKWQSHFLRYIDTRPNGDALRKCILEGPYKLTTITILVVPTTDDTLVVLERTAVKIFLHMYSENKAHYQSEKEAIHLLLTGIGDEIYSTSYYSRFYKMMNEMIRNNLTVATMQVNVQFLQQLQQKWSRFVTIVKQNHDLDTISYHKLFDVLKQYQKEVYEIRSKRIAKNANPLALVAAVQHYLDPYYQAPKSHKSFAPPSKQPSSTRSHASTRYKGKGIAKTITPPSESASEEDSDPKQAQRDKDMQKNLAHIAKYFKKIYKPTNNNLITSSNSKNNNVDTSPRYKNDNQTGQFRNRRTVTVAGARETVGSQVVQQTVIQSEKGVPLQAEQANWIEDTDEEIYEQELEAHYSYMEKIQVVPTADSGTGTKPLEKTDQNAEEYDNKRVALANLIAYLTLDTEENKKILKQLKKANASLTQELKEYKSTLEKTNRTLRESDSTQDSCRIALQNKQTVLETELVDQAWVKHSKDHFRAPTALDMEVLIKTCLMPLALKTQNDSFVFVHELKQEMYVDLKYVESLENEIDELESDKAQFSNMYDMLLQECVSNYVMCSYLHSLSDLDAHTELQCLYLHKVKECECLAQNLSKQTEFVKQMKNDTVCKEKASNVFLKEREQYFEIQDLKAQLQDKDIAICELKKLIEKCKGKSVETKFDKPSVVRQPNAQRIPKPSVLGKPTPFSDSLERKHFSKTKSVPKTNVSEGLSKPVTTQNLPQTARKAVSNTNVIKPGMYRIDTRTTQTRAPQLPQTYKNTNPRMSTSTGVAHRTNVSRPQPRSTQMKDKVVPNTSQVKFKKTEVEDYHRIFNISN